MTIRRRLLGISFGLAGSAALAQQVTSRVPPGTFCTNQDNLFVLNFDWLVVVLVAGLAFFGLPTVMALLTPGAWSLTSPFRRWLYCAIILGSVAGVVFLLLPVLGVRGVVDPPVGLLGYPGVDSQYLLRCPAESFQATPLFFGVFGSQRKAAIAQPYAMAMAFLLAAVLWSALHRGVFLLIRRRRGLHAR